MSGYGSLGFDGPERRKFERVGSAVSIMDRLHGLLRQLLAVCADAEDFNEQAASGLLSLAWGKSPVDQPLSRLSLTEPYFLESANTASWKSFHLEAEGTRRRVWRDLGDLFLEESTPEVVSCLLAEYDSFAAARLFVAGWPDASAFYGPHPQGLELDTTGPVPQLLVS